MRLREAGLVLGAIHMALVGSVGLKLLVDRGSLPRGWARTAPFDPTLPIRGRYVRLRLEVPLSGVTDSAGTYHGVRLNAVDGRLVGVIDDSLRDRRVRIERRDGEFIGVIEEAVAFFIPEHVPDPSIRPPGEQLWAEVTVPKQGPARPIQRGVVTDGSPVPLPIR